MCGRRPAVALFDELNADARFYFLHSYFIECDRDENVIATCDYGMPFGCAVQSGNVYGVQFHPEKSHRFGERLLKNFADLPGIRALMTVDAWLAGRRLTVCGDEALSRPAVALGQGTPGTGK